MHLRRFNRDERGVAAVEFALLAPVMILLYFGLAELSMGMMAERRAAHAASVMADLVAQESQISGTQITDIFNVSHRIMAPFPSAPLQMRISSLTADASARLSVAWSKGDAMAIGAAAGVPAGLVAANDSVIRADVTYVFTSPIGQVLPNALTYHETFYLRPRKGTQVTWSGS
jgi:Flp pilus assembly protein TadG